MAIQDRMNAILVVPQGGGPVEAAFVEFLVKQELGAYLVAEPWRPVEGIVKTRLGIRVSPGNC